MCPPRRPTTAWHSLAALAGGGVRAWGSHVEGQASGPLSSDTPHQLTPLPVAGLAGITRVSAGARHSFALDASGRWYGWGSNREGQLGFTGSLGGAGPVALPTFGLFDLAGGHDAAPTLSVFQLTRYAAYDAQGSVRFLTSPAGAVTARYDYDAFGTLLGLSGENPLGSDAFLYRGERFDALTGLYHLRARDYDPALGRFHQIDDFAGFADNPHSLNRYNYAESNPVGNFDPAGRFAVNNLTSPVYALHLKDQYLAELVTAGPQYTFDPDEALNDDFYSDFLIAASAPLKLKERQLWVRASGGGLLGSWVNESGSSESSERKNDAGGIAGGSGFGAGSDVFFLHQTGARFRQGWAARQVEQAWRALQQSRLNLNLGPRFPDDPRSQRIAEGNIRLKGTRWADAIYADALLQASLRSATSEGRRAVRAHFTPTPAGRRYDARGVDLTARATTALNAAAGGGPLDWEQVMQPGQANAFLAAESKRNPEWSAADDFRGQLAQRPAAYLQTVASASPWLVNPRVWGTVQTIGGVTATAIGAYTATQTAGLSFALSIAAIAHGADQTIAGVRQTITGEWTNTVTVEALAKVTGGETSAALADAGLSFLLANPAATARVLAGAGRLAAKGAQTGYGAARAVGRSVGASIGEAMVTGRPWVKLGDVELFKPPTLALLSPEQARLVNLADQVPTVPPTSRQLAFDFANNLDKPARLSNWGAAENGLFSHAAGDAMDAGSLSRIESAFARNGGVIDQSADAQAYLRTRGAEGVTFSKDTVLLPAQPSRSAVFEELIHTAQHRTGRFSGNNVVQMEIEAAEKLIRFRRGYGIPNAETRATIERLRALRAQAAE